MSDEQAAAARNQRFHEYWAARAAAQAGDVSAADVEAARVRNAQFRTLSDELGAREATPGQPRKRPYTPG